MQHVHQQHHWNFNVVRHRFDSKDLEEATGCAREGIGFTDDWEESVKQEEVNLTFSGCPYTESKATKDLLPKARFLHLLLTRCVTPIKSQDNTILKQDKFALYHHMQFRKIYINDMIFNHMLKIVKQKTKTCYPYGMLLTRLIRNKGTILNSEFLNMTPILSVATLAELGLKNEDGVELTVRQNPRISEKSYF